LSLHSGMSPPLRKLVPRSSLELASGTVLLDATPLLEEEGDRLRDALVTQTADPRLLHRSCAWSTLSTNDHPIDRSEVERTYIFDQWLDRKEARAGDRMSEMFNSRHSVLAVLDGDAEPDVFRLREPRCLLRPGLEALRSLREHLIRVLRRPPHDVED